MQIENFEKAKGLIRELENQMVYLERLKDADSVSIYSKAGFKITSSGEKDLEYIKQDSEDYIARVRYLVRHRIENLKREIETL